MPDAGRRVEAFMKAAMARSDRVRTVTALATAAGVQRQTLYDIWRGRPPKPGTVEVVTHALDETPGAFWAAWEGREEEPPVSTDVAAAIDRQTLMLERIAEVLENLDRATLRPAGPADAVRVARARQELEADLDAFEESSSLRSNGDHPDRSQ